VQERAISLSLKMCPSNQGSLAIIARQELSPTHCISSVTLSIISTSNSRVKRERDTHPMAVLLHTIAISGLRRVRTEPFRLLVIPSLAHRPVHLNR